MARAYRDRQDRRRDRIIARPQPPPALNGLRQFDVAGSVHRDASLRHRGPEQETLDRRNVAVQDLPLESGSVVTAVAESLPAPHHRNDGKRHVAERFEEIAVFVPVTRDRSRSAPTEQALRGGDRAGPARTGR